MTILSAPPVWISGPPVWFQEERPYLIGFGPATFSTSTALAPLVQWCADANGYYAALGVDWRAGKRELREAYQARGGPDSAYLTYVLKQLLDTELRAIYNSRELGHPLLDDYVLRSIRVKVRVNADQETMVRITEFERDFFSSGEEDKPGQEADEPGQEADEKTLQAFLDSKESDVHDGGASPDPGYRYSHYVFRSTAGDRSLLPEWQRLVIESCRRQGIEVSIALGFHGASTDPWLVQRVGYVVVIFFHENRLPDALYADDAVQYIHSIIRRAQPE